METKGKVITCRAAVAWEPNKPLKVEEVQVSAPKQGEVRIKICYTAICHTDIVGLKKLDPNQPFPVIFGHEGAGIVESVGPGVTSVLPGDLVIPSSHPHCRECANCKNPGTNICDKVMYGSNRSYTMDDGGTRFSCRGKPVYHFIGTSTFSEYTVVREECVAKINPGAPLDRACLIGCGVTTGYGAPFNSCLVKPGNIVAVWGMGAIGLAMLMGCREQGAQRIFAIDFNEERLANAAKFGATDLLNPRNLPEGSTLPEYFREKFNGGIDIAFEATGCPQAMADAMECTKVGTGQTCVVGVCLEKIPLSAIDLLWGRTVRGCILGGTKPRDDMPILVEKYLAGKLMLDEFISWRFPSLEQINEAIDHLNKGQGIRSVITVAAEST